MKHYINYVGYSDRKIVIQYIKIHLRIKSIPQKGQIKPLYNTGGRGVSDTLKIGDGIYEKPLTVNDV